jgi:PAS domain S-box-containing protein
MISFKFILGVLFLSLVGGIGVMGVVSFKNNKVSLNNAELVQHSHAVLDLTGVISSLYKDIQLESNAYFIHEDSSVVHPYRLARNEVIPRINNLRSLTRDNARQQSEVDSLQRLIVQLIQFTDSGFDAKGGFTSLELDARAMKNFRFRERIRERIAAIKSEEENVLLQRETAYRLSIKAFNNAFFLLIGGIGVLLATTFFSIRYNFNKRIRAQEEQKRANELFSKIFYESPVGIVISNLASGKIIDCNNSYTELLHYKKFEVIGKTAVELGIVSDEAQRNDMIKNVRENGIVRDVEIQLIRQKSGPIWVSKSMQTIWINNEECLLSAVLDMTSHREAEERIKQALHAEIELNKLKSNFVTLASHEFRTPLTTILSSAFLIDNYALGENKEKISRHISRIKASVNLLISILDEFLSLTKIEEGRIEPKLELINIRERIENLCGSLRAFARPGQTIVYKHTGDEQIYSDPVLLENIVNNLVSNALKYSGENSEIVVSTNVNANVHLCVCDQGIGISKDDQKHLFERFFRASNTGNIQGTGLGLHIMKYYVDMLKGSIEVHSEPGKGSRFNVTFEQLHPVETDH